MSLDEIILEFSSFITWNKYHVEGSSEGLRNVKKLQDKLSGKSIDVKEAGRVGDQINLALGGALRGAHGVGNKITVPRQRQVHRGIMPTTHSSAADAAGRHSRVHPGLREALRPRLNSSGRLRDRIRTSTRLEHSHLGPIAIVPGTNAISPGPIAIVPGTNPIAPCANAIRPGANAIRSVRIYL